MPRTTPAESNNSASGFSFPAVGGKKITAAFLLAQAERGMGIRRRLAASIADPRDPTRVIRLLDDILRARVLAIACSY